MQPLPCEPLSDEEVLRVLHSLRDFWVDDLDIDLNKDELPNDPDEHLEDYLNRVTHDDSFGLHSFVCSLERCFHASVQDSLLERWWNGQQGDRSTSDDGSGNHWPAGLRGLATWVVCSRAMSQRPIEPMRVGTHQCLAAGVFLKLRDIVARLKSQEVRFGPSTPVADVVRGQQMLSLWEVAELESEVILPKIWDRWDRHALSGLLAFLSLFVSVIAFFLGADWTVLSWGMLATALWSLARVFRMAPENYLPENLTTFRDWSKLIAERIEATSVPVG